MVTRRLKSVGCLGLLLGACNVDQAPRPEGIAPGGDAGTSSADGAASDSASYTASARACASAVAVISSDYKSTNVSAISATGTVLSESILSSGSAAAGLSAPLSGDVSLPLSAPNAGQLVLLDRSNSVLTWVDPTTATVVRQLPVGTGFDSNPHDYLELSGNKAYVTRYNSNPTPGVEPNDAGGDVLVVDTTTFAIAKTIPLAAAADGAFLPRPDRMLAIGNEVWVLLHRFDNDYASIGDARIVGISTVDDTVAWTLDLPGIADCGGVAVAPSGDVVALSCAGMFGELPIGNRSAIALIDATVHPPVEITRFPAASQLGAPFGLSLAFATEDVVVGVVPGDLQTGQNDVAFKLHTSAQAKAELLLANVGQAFTLGDVYCDPGCTNLCFMTDGQNGGDETTCEGLPGDRIAQGSFM